MRRWLQNLVRIIRRIGDCDEIGDICGTREVNADIRDIYGIEDLKAYIKDIYKVENVKVDIEANWERR
jgi:hypothetical protein